MPMPNITGQDRKKPLCYDPARDRYITFDDILSGNEKIIPIEELSREDLAKLIIRRHKVGPDYKVQAISGSPMTRDEVVQAMENGEPFGRITIEADAAYLKFLLEQIRQSLK